MGDGRTSDEHRVAAIGDWVIVEGTMPGVPRRQGKIVGLAHPDGSPPYWVRWVEDDHESLFFPGPDGRVAAHPVAPDVVVGHAVPVHEADGVGGGGTPPVTS
jgi:hypothetical protein